MGEKWEGKGQIYLNKSLSLRSVDILYAFGLNFGWKSNTYNFYMSTIYL